MSQMKPQLIQEIADAVMARIEEEYGKRLKKLESKASEKNRQDGEGNRRRQFRERAKGSMSQSLMTNIRLGDGSTIRILTMVNFCIKCGRMEVIIHS